MRALGCLVLVACRGSSEPPPAPPPPAPRDAAAPVDAPPALGDVAGIAVGDKHTCVLDAQGTLACWGSNAEGQLGIADRHVHATPVVAMHGDLTQVAASAERTCVLHRNGEVECFGLLPGGTDRKIVASGIDQIRDACMRAHTGTVACFSRSNKLVQVAIEHATDVAGGAEGGCATIDGGAVRCWHDDAAVPATVSGIAAPVAIAVGDNFACALVHDGHVACWGVAWEGVLGRGTLIPTPRPTMRYVPPKREPPAPVVGIDDAIAIAAGGGYACAVRRDRTVACWGKQVYFVANGTATPRAIATITDARLLAAGKHACVVGEGHAVTCWGAGDAGELGNGWSEAHPEPIAVPGLSDAIAIQEACALRATRRVACWGFPGDPIDGNAHDLPKLHDVATGADRFTVDRDGAVWELYEGRAEQKHVPPAVQTSRRCAVTRDGHVWCWGNAHSLSSGVRPDPTPREVRGIDDAIAVADGEYHTCILHKPGSIVCLFVDDMYAGFDLRQPVAVPVVTDATAVASFGDRDCAQRKDRSVWCWRWKLDEVKSGAHWNADHSYLGPPPPEPSPERVFLEATAFAVGYDAACAVQSNGRVGCIGNNELGQAPGQLPGITDAIGVSAGYRYACALHKPGTVSCWGRTTNGDVGTLPTHYVATPQRVRF